MSVAISWANKMQLAKCDIMVGFPKSSHIYVLSTGFYSSMYVCNSAHDQMGLTKLFHEIAVTSTTHLYPKHFRDVLQQQSNK